MLLSPYAKSPGLELVPHQLGERISELSKQELAVNVNKSDVNDFNDEDFGLC